MNLLNNIDNQMLEDEFNQIRNDLNLDDETAKDAWNNFRRIGVNYSLEGDKVAWISCSLYVSCRRCITQTVGKQNKIEGNLVSLTRILRSCNISLMKFFNKMKNWTEMANLPNEMKVKLDQLERNFNVTTVMFKKFRPIFEDIFKCPSQIPCRFMSKNRKQIRKQALTSLDIFTFCWSLFIYIKSNYSQISDDLVNSYHLLLVCLDYCFSSVLSFDNYKDIVNTNFYEKLTAKLGNDARLHNNDNRVTIIDILCDKWNGIPIEVKQIKKHWFKNFLKIKIDNKDLKKRENGIGILDSDVIDFNYKYIKQEYETFVLSIGDFDECVFLNETASEELGTSEFQSGDLDEVLRSRFQRIHHDQPNNLMPMTPLSSKQYLATRTPVNKTVPLTPISSATASIGRLQSILIDRRNGPSDDLEKLFDLCKVNPKQKIEAIIESMGNIFIECYSKENTSQSVIKSAHNEIQYILTEGNEFAKNRLHLAVTFFYNIFEKILKSEIRQRIPEAQLAERLTKMVEMDIFIRSLFACSLEIVLFSYSPCNRVFPWILDIFNDNRELSIHPFYFYKVIEPIIRDEQGLSRDIVKHLNAVEEKILESLAWTKDSPLWIQLDRNGRAPNCADVSLNIFNSEKRENNASLINSPAIKSGFNNSIMNVYNNVDNRCTVKRQLQFTDAISRADTQATSSSVLTFTLPSPNPVSSNNVKVDDHNEKPSLSNQNKTNLTNSPTPSGQLSLFFRKVYSLASLRLRDLCQRLHITSDDSQMKIWTCLEHALSVHYDLMCEHHLDQILMCSIFCVCKVGKISDNVTFQEIIRCYRLQPQAVNHVYRTVLLCNRKMSAISSNGSSSAEVSPGNSASSSQPSTPTRPFGSLDSKENSTGSIIEFYNKVFIQNLTQAYILKFSPDEKNSPTLSPMPANKYSSSILHSPHRRVSKFPVYISPLRPSTYPQSPNRPMSFRFQNDHSSSQELKAINTMMKSSANINNAKQDLKATVATAMMMMKSGTGTPGVKRISKRILQDDQESDSSQSNKYFCNDTIMDRKIRDIVADRQIISASSSANVSVTEDSNDSIPFNHPPLPNNTNNNILNIQQQHSPPALIIDANLINNLDTPNLIPNSQQLNNYTNGNGNLIMQSSPAINMVSSE